MRASRDLGSQSPRVALVIVCALFVPTGQSSAMSVMPQLEPPSATEQADQRIVATPAGMADRVVVKKAQRRLYLMRGETILRSYPIALGFQPLGHKRHEGDGRTPEGRYRLDWRNARGRYHKALHISYPATHDEARARWHDLAPGGLILIHGQPGGQRAARREGDWTDGCIAVSNAEMDEIWALTQDGIPIDILPD